MTEHNVDLVADNWASRTQAMSLHSFFGIWRYSRRRGSKNSKDAGTSSYCVCGCAKRDCGTTIATGLFIPGKRDGKYVLYTTFSFDTDSMDSAYLLPNQSQMWWRDWMAPLICLKRKLYLLVTFRCTLRLMRMTPTTTMMTALLNKA